MVPEHLQKFTELTIVNPDGFGGIALVDVMGDDSAIARAARTSYGKGTKRARNDRNLIRYLVNHRHTTPLEMCEIVLFVRVPMDTWRQWIRHRTASVNEYSTRYSEAIDEVATTRPDEWRFQSTTNNQGSSGFLDEETGFLLSSEERDLHEHIKNVYESRLAKGVAREQARKDLSLSNYTQAYWKIDLHNLLHFLSLRVDSHAQIEIRRYANAILDIVKEWVPHTYDAFMDYRMQSRTFSRMDMEILLSVVEKADKGAIEEMISFNDELTVREKIDLRRKLGLND